MVHVAKEMKREGVTLPLLIGGATTSLGPIPRCGSPSEYPPGVFHVLDASRVVNVVQLDPRALEAGPAFFADNRDKQQKQREDFAARRQRRPLLGLAEARARRETFDWAAVDIPRPEVSSSPADRIRLRTRRTRPLHRLRPLLQRLGAPQGATIPTS